MAFVFDYKEMPGGAPLNQGRSAALKPGTLSEWLVDHSPYSPRDFESAPTSGPRDDELDYALVRLADAPGDDAISGTSRGHMRLPEAADVERDADRVRVFLGVVKARYEGHDRLLRNDQPESEFCRYRAAAVHRQSNLNLGVGARLGIPGSLL